jgi:anti-sigma B factor antagonist
MQAPVTVTRRAAGEAVVLDLRGDVTTAAEGPILAAYEALAAEGCQRFVLNFTAVEYINSSGIAIVINLITRARRAAQRLTIFGLDPHQQKMFRIVGVDRYAPLCAGEDEALAALA